jgi:hypothetical protein
MNMSAVLDERNIYEWAENFIRNGETAGKENRLMNLIK